MPSERVQRQIDTLLDEAEEAARLGDWKTVRDRADAVLAYDPGNEDARHHIAAAERRLLNLPQAGSRATAAPFVGQKSTAPPSGDAPSSSANGAPVSFASGRYVVKKKLGEGGKKRVYLAHDTALDRDVAFALIKTQGLDETGRERITREAQAMGRLGDHQNIVPIFDLGTEIDAATGMPQPFMVQPLMLGDIEGEIEKATDHRLNLVRVLQIAKDTARGLEFAHSNGIVHRDIKPGNVWFTRDGTARIGDFGLAIATDRSRLTREGMMVGTVSYMPPEQAMGGEITPRADLYSLGCMLYEMVTGRPPFLGDDDIAIIGQHINTAPVAPTWHRPDCPKTLDSLIMRLLAKDPKQRPERAGDVLAALEGVQLVTMPAKAGIQMPAGGGQTGRAPSGRLDPSLRWDGNSTSETAQQESGRSLDSMSSGVFVGRQKEMDQLRAALEEVLSGHGRLITLVGEPGIGKTRTAQELATYAGLRRSQVLWGRCYEGGGAPPYWPWVQAIRSYVRERDPQELKREMGSTASVIAEVVADIKDRIPGIEPPPQLDSPESARFRLFDSISAFLKTASSTQPLVLVLDDLHWSDKPSLLLLEFVARELANSRLMVVGTYRDVEVNRKHPLSQTLGELSKERLFEKVLLRGIQKEDVARFIELAAGMKPPSGLVEAIHTQTAGNPLFVTEVVRWLIQEGSLAPEKVKSRSSWSMPIPEGIRDVIGKRLDRLSERCNDVLTTAAVIGRRFAMPALAKLYSDPKLPLEERLSEERLLELMEEALAARVIEELPSGPGRYQFTHALMQETLTSELSTTRRVRLHARIALALEEIYGGRAEEHAAELAAHFAEAESMLGPIKLVRYSLLAGNQALAGFGFEEALRHFERGIAGKAGNEDSEAGELLFGLAKAQAVLFGRHEIDRAAKTLQQSFYLLSRLGHTERALTVAQFLFPNFHGTAGLTEMYESALNAAVPGSRDFGVLSERVGMFASMEKGQYRPDRIRDSVQIAVSVDDPDFELRARTWAGFFAWAHKDFETNKIEMQNARQVLPRCSDLRSKWEFRDAAAVQQILSGNPVAGIVDGRLGLEDAEKLRGKNFIVFSLSNIAISNAMMGRWDEVQANLNRGLELDRNEFRLVFAKFIMAVSKGDAEGLKSALEVARITPGIWGDQFWMMFADEVVELGLGEYVAASLDKLEASLATPSEPLLEDRKLVASALGAAALGDEKRRKHYADLAYQRVIECLGHPFRAARETALVVRTMGQPKVALTLLEEAANTYRDGGALAMLSRTLYHTSDLLESEFRDHARASTRSDEALQIARELGMKPLIERILKRRQFLKA